MSLNARVRVEQQGDTSSARIVFVSDSRIVADAVVRVTSTGTPERPIEDAIATSPAKRTRSRRKMRPAAPSWRKQLAHALKEDEESRDVSRVWRGILDHLEHTVPMARPTSPGADLSSHEAALLARGSVGLDVSRATTARVLARTAGMWADLLAESAGVAEAARLIGVQESRVRQRLGDRTLYGFKHDGVWYIPRFQFYRDQLLPGIAAVVPHVPKTLAPLAVVSWFVTPTADLALNGHATSPRDWLIAGGEPTAVAALASDL